MVQRSDQFSTHWPAIHQKLKSGIFSPGSQTGDVLMKEENPAPRMVAVLQTQQVSEV